MLSKYLSLALINVISVFSLPAYANQCPNLPIDQENLSSGKPFLIDPIPNHTGGSSWTGDYSTWLTDNQCGGGWIDLHTISWMHRDAAQVTVNLGQEKLINDIQLNLFARAASGVYCPRKIRFEVADSNGKYHTVGEWQNTNLTSQDENLCGNAVWPGETQYRHINATADIINSPLNVRGSQIRVTAYSNPQVEDNRNFFQFDEITVAGSSDQARIQAANNLPPTNFVAKTANLQTTNDGSRALAIYPYDIGKNFYAQDFDANLTTPPDSPTINMNLQRGETGQIELLLVNPNSSQKSFQLNNISISGIPISNVEVREGLSVKSADLTDRIDSLSKINIPSSSPQTLSIAANSNKGLFISLKVPDTLTPGDYAATLTLTDWLNTTRNVFVNIKVGAHILPKVTNMESTWFDWSYPLSTFGTNLWARHSQRAQVRSWAEMSGHVIYDIPYSTSNNDFTWLNVELDNYPDSKIHILNLGADLQLSAQPCYDSADWQSKYQAWVTAIAKNIIITKGIPVNKFAFYVADEPNSDVSAYPDTDTRTCNPMTRLEYTKRAINAIKTINSPDFSGPLQVFVNPTTTNLDQLNQLASAAGSSKIDIWAPPLSAIVKDSQLNSSHPLLSFYQDRQSKGEQFWAYNEIISPISFSDTKPNEARALPWVIASYGITGYGYWNFYSPTSLVTPGLTNDQMAIWKNRAYLMTSTNKLTNGSFFDTSTGQRSTWSHVTGSSDKPDYSMIYINDSADPFAPSNTTFLEPVSPSRRLASLRQGIEDARYIDLVKQLLITTKSSTSSAYAQNYYDAQQLYSDALTSGGNKNFDVARAKLIQAADLLKSLSNSTLTVMAKGDLAADKGPMMGLWIDGLKVDQQEVTSTDYKPYVFSTYFKKGQNAKIDIVFQNDYWVETPLQDRNLYVKSLQIGSSTAISPLGNALYDVGIGAAAFDGQNVRSGYEVWANYNWVPWVNGVAAMEGNGALRFNIQGSTFQ